MKKLITITLLIAFIFLSCKNQYQHSISKVSEKNDTIKQLPNSSLPFFDTSIVLKGITSTDISNEYISSKEAEQFLYQYFKKRKVIIAKNFKSTSDIVTRSCVQYDTIYQFSTDKFTGVIVSYWLGECDLNGHGFQPSKALIVITKKGYELSNEEFIPTNYMIDSVVKSDIYGYYECNRSVLRHFKIKLQ